MREAFKKGKEDVQGRHPREHQGFSCLEKAGRHLAKAAEKNTRGAGGRTGMRGCLETNEGESVKRSETVHKVKHPSRACR